MTIKEATEKWTITVLQVQNHCKGGQIRSVQKIGTNLFLPKGCYETRKSSLKYAR